MIRLWINKIMRAIRLHPKAHKVYVDTETTGLQTAARIYVRKGDSLEVIE